jgi:hypothetical protein
MRASGISSSWDRARESPAGYNRDGLDLMQDHDEVALFTFPFLNQLFDLVKHLLVHITLSI